MTIDFGRLKSLAAELKRAGAGTASGPGLPRFAFLVLLATVRQRSSGPRARASNAAWGKRIASIPGVVIRPRAWTAYAAIFKKGFSHELDAASEDEKKRTVQDVVRSSSSVAALVAVQPLPVVDAALINPILHRMVQAIGRVYGYGANVGDGQRIFKTLRGKLITLNAAIAGAKLVPFVPFIGDLFAMSVAYALTWAVGEVSDRYFRSGCTMDAAQMLDTFNAAYKDRYEHVYKQKRNELRAMWRAPGVRRQIEELKQAQREGKLTDEEMERVTDELLNQG